jgi:hypothetical protein
MMIKILLLSICFIQNDSFFYKAFKRGLASKEAILVLPVTIDNEQDRLEVTASILKEYFVSTNSTFIDDGKLSMELSSIYCGEKVFHLDFKKLQTLLSEKKGRIPPFINLSDGKNRYIDSIKNNKEKVLSNLTFDYFKNKDKPLLHYTSSYFSKEIVEGLFSVGVLTIQSDGDIYLLDISNPNSWGSDSQ